MTQSAILSVLTFAEIALIAIAFAVVVVRRNRNLLLQLEKLKIKIKSITEDKNQFKQYLEQVISETQDKMQQCPQQQSDLLEKRMMFLKSEISALEEPQTNDSYWQHICDRISTFISHHPVTEPTPTEQSTPPREEESSGYIPTLDRVRTVPEVSIDTTNDDIQRLRTIISRQFESIDSLKESLSQSENSDAVAELNRKLQEMQGSQNQLLLCIQTLEQDNDRLHAMLHNRDDLPADSDVDLLTIAKTKEKLVEANRKLTNMEHENKRHMQTIRELQRELNQFRPTKTAKQPPSLDELLSDDLNLADKSKK
ncbi:MAG: hypothetical protein OEZ68_19880 [Gammaproteobacteria bacterium]|nr:hypothetical protein [Gammaproteobacteria bacterium]MDH5803070.1 hypothetical protein [Gammaproteobacteria bacterium]